MGTDDLAARIERYRRDADMSQQDLAREVGVDRTAIAKIETGVRKVSALELSELARALKVRMEWFFTDPAPAIVAYRESAPDQTPATVDAWIERATRESLFIHDHAHKTWPGLQTRLGSRTGPEQLAAWVRTRMGLDRTQAVRRIADAASRIGVLLFCVDLGADAPDGASAPADGFGVAVVNGQREVGRRRLTAAHELGHLIVEDPYRVDWRVDEPDSDRNETTMDQFARALLLPRRAMLDRWSQAGSEVFDVRRQALLDASEFQVDMSTLARRLLTLKLIDGAVAARIRTFRHTKADFFELDLVKRTDLDVPSVPQPYSQAVLAMYRSETVSADRAVDLLMGTLDEADLPVLDSLPDEAAWALL